MAYDKSTDFKQIQADVLTTDVSDNDLVSSLKQLNTDNKSITKAINVLHEQLGNAQTSAADAVARVVELEQVNAQQAALITSLQTELAALKESAGKQEEVNSDPGEGNENGGSESGNGESGGGNNNHLQAEHVYGMVLAEEGNYAGTWVRVNKNFETVDFNPEHGTWAGMKQVQNDTYGEFTEIPVTWVRTETLADGPYAGKNCWWIADGPEEGFHVHPAFIGQDGQPHNLQIASWIASNKNNVPFSVDKGNYWNNISYDTIHAKGWMSDGLRPFNIYDNHFLARMMLIEFGTPDIQSLTIDGVAWTGAKRIAYHGINDPFGFNGEWFYLDGFTIANGIYQVMAADGSLSMINTEIPCFANAAWPINCRVDKVKGIDFGDLFIANKENIVENSGSFADCQYLCISNSSTRFTAFSTGWYTMQRQGAFCLGMGPGTANQSIAWRVSRCI